MGCNRRPGYAAAGVVGMTGRSEPAGVTGGSAPTPVTPAGSGQSKAGRRF